MERSTIKRLGRSFESVLWTSAVAQKPTGLVSFRFAGHADPIGTLLEEGASGLYPIQLAARPEHVAAEGDGARVRKTTRSSRQRDRGRKEGVAGRIRAM